MKKKKKEAPEMRKVQISTPVAISRAEAEIGDAVMGAARKYGLTSTWLDCALANVVVKVKEMRTAEYAAELTRMTLEMDTMQRKAEEEGEENGESTDNQG
ncbi:hypothetical protein AALH30_24425 [Blautia pseudococcoides]|uniref:hypothetical protein n=1 Tax=Blautia pseudococcoides TaxID=1796616 RepID=UPI00148B0A7B|nr:hypothetical protein [Blautia pseudococcoides]MCR2020604.1 hypothetical protein [Blautia pseudococcoides]QJU13293.1 hypothetical protein HL650_01665 [Blautia pseudococcoides]QJU14779.1 hypothetical protein HL650_10125 [Blautia pseudococcoides]